MAETPPIRVKMDSAEVQELVTRGVAQGRLEGRSQGMAVVLSWLEDAYLNDPGRPDRGSPKAEAILELATECAKFIRKELKKK